MGMGLLTLKSHEERGHTVLKKAEVRAAAFDNNIMRTMQVWYVCSCGESWRGYERETDEAGLHTTMSHTPGS